MKKILLVFAVCCFSFGHSQVVDVASISEVNLPKGTTCDMFTLSPTGEYMLMTDCSYNGLKKMDFATQTVTTVTNAKGAGYNPIIMADGNTIVYRETSFTNGNLRQTALKSKNLATGAEVTIATPSRDIEGVAVTDGQVYTINKGKYSTKALKSTTKADKKMPVLSIENRQLMITINGKTNTFSPNGTSESYLWPSLSPDQAKVLYYVGGNGAYICNIDGSNVTYIGKLRAAKWYNNNVVVGMRDKDNGEYTVQSSIIAKNILTQEEQVLNNDSTIAMYPSVSQKGDKILFSTPEGKAYIINVNVK